METGFKTDFEHLCRMHGIYAPRRMDAPKLKEKWAELQKKYPEGYHELCSRYPGTESWDNLMKLYFRG